MSVSNPARGSWLVKALLAVASVWVGGTVGVLTGCEKTSAPPPPPPPLPTQPANTVVVDPGPAPTSTTPPVSTLVDPDGPVPPPPPTGTADPIETDPAPVVKYGGPPVPNPIPGPSPMYGGFNVPPSSSATVTTVRPKYGVTRYGTTK